MKKYNLKRFLASLLAVLMLASVTGVSPAVFAADDSLVKSSSSSEPIEVLIKSSFTDDEVSDALAKALLKDPTQVNANDLSWTYTCTVTTKFKDKLGVPHTTDPKTETVSVNGQSINDKYKFYGTNYDVTYNFPALKDNTDGAYTLYLNGQPVYINKVAKLKSSIEKKADSISVPLTYLDATTIDYSVLDADVFNAAVAGSTPDLTVNDVTVSYWARSKTSKDEQWMPLAGGKGDWNNISLTYPAVGEGTYKVKIEYPANDRYYGSSIELNVTFLGREASVISFKENPTVKIQYNDDLSIKLDELKDAIWENVVDSTTHADLSPANVSIKYYASPKTGSVTETDKNWVPLNGGEAPVLGFPITYPAISEGTWKLLFEFAGNADYKGFSEEVEVKFTGRDPAFELKDNVEGMEIGLVFKSATEYDYDATAAAIREALVTKLGTIDLSEVKVQYKPSIGKVENLDYQPTEILGQDVGKAFGEGEFTIVLTWGDGKGTAQYKPFSEEVTVKMVDNRIPSVVALVDVANITYNMDASKMIEEIIKNAIDSANSTLPADYKASDFTVRYDDDGTWAPIEGEYKTILGQTVTIHSHLNAGDGQQILVTYNGSAEYKPSDTAEGTLNVAKADVKVNIKRPFITMHAGDADLPEGSITLDPDDPEIDVYTIFAGVTSKIGGKVTTSVYLDLPDRFTNNEALTHVLDPLVEKIIGKSFTEILQEGITVGELRQLAKAATSAAETLKPVLNAVGIDIDSFLKVMELINNLPSIADDMVIAIGTPNHAGVYQAFAVTNSINYNTAFGTGTVLVLKNFTGVEIVKSNKLDDGKLTAKEAQDIFDGNDQLCTLQKDSKDLNKAAQKALHYRFTGINGGKLYSSHDMPVDPGKYIVTVSVRGGDYYALPTTFTFTIVADPTPEVTPET